MRDIGKPDITVHVLAGTSEATAQNRENLRSVCERIYCEAIGRPVKVTIEWQGEEKDSGGKIERSWNDSFII